MGAYVRTDAAAGGRRPRARVRALSRSWPSGGARPAGTLSGGEQQMLAIGRALMARPRLILFDEPSLGLAPTVVETVFAIIARHPARGHDGAHGGAERLHGAPARHPRLRHGDGAHHARGRRRASSSTTSSVKRPTSEAREWERSTSARRCRGGKTRGSCAARAASSTTSSCPGCSTPPSSGARTRTRGSSAIRTDAARAPARRRPRLHLRRPRPLDEAAAALRRACRRGSPRGSQVTMKQVPAARAVPRRGPPRRRDRGHGARGQPRPRRGRRRAGRGRLRAAAAGGRDMVAGGGAGRAGHPPGVGRQRRGATSDRLRRRRRARSRGAGRRSASASTSSATSACPSRRAAWWRSGTRATASLTTWNATQVVHFVQQGLVAALGLPAHKVRVIAPDVGGGFGTKANGYPEDLLIPVAAIVAPAPGEVDRGPARAHDGLGPRAPPGARHRDRRAARRHHARRARPDLGRPRRLQRAGASCCPTTRWRTCSARIACRASTSSAAAS